MPQFPLSKKRIKIISLSLKLSFVLLNYISFGHMQRLRFYDTVPTQHQGSTELHAGLLAALTQAELDWFSWLSITMEVQP